MQYYFKIIDKKVEKFSKNGDMLTCFICYTIEKRTNVRIENKKRGTQNGVLGKVMR